MQPHKRRILCVDDDPETCLMLCSLFELLNCEVVSAATVNEAWDKIRSDTFDLYMLDNWLPGGSGVELCLRIRETDATTPVVFYTGAGYEAERQEALDAGAQVYLLKPTHIAQLLDTVKRLLSMDKHG